MAHPRFPWRTTLQGIGIRHAYPHLPLPTRARAYIAAARPLPVVAGPLLVGGGFAVLASGGPILEAGWPWLLGVLALILAGAGSNLVNAYADAAADQLNRPYRPLPRGLLKPEEALGAGVMCWLLAVVLAAPLGGLFTLLLSLIIILAHAYNSEPLRWKRVLGLNYVTIALARGALGVLAAVSIYQDPFHEPWLGFALVAFLWTLGGVPSKDYGDEAGDRAQSVVTLATRVPHRDAGMLMLTPTSLAGAILLVLTFTGNLPWPFVFTGFTLVAIAAWIGHLVMHGNGGQENRLAEGRKAWLLYYAGFGLLGLTAWLSTVHP